MDAMGRPCLKCQPSSRTGENPPYGMIGGTVETSASFEARYAPLSYPTAGGAERSASLPRPKLEAAERAKERLQHIGLSPTRTDVALTILWNAYGGIGVKD